MKVSWRVSVRLEIISSGIVGADAVIQMMSNRKI